MTAALRLRTCVVTGASSGIGYATARQLAQRGERVAIVCRDSARGSRARRDLVAQSGNSEIALFAGDLSSFESVGSLAAELRAAYSAIDVLINNAGALFSQRRISEDGVEMHLATNYLGPFLLTQLLLPALRQARGRILNVSSFIHRICRIRFDDLNFDRRYYHLTWGYGQSKLAVILFTRDLARRLEGSGVSVNCLDPGLVRTRIGEKEGVGGWAQRFWRLFNPLGAEPEVAAESLVWLATSQALEGVSGQYFVGRRPRRPGRSARDLNSARRLFALSCERIGRAARPAEASAARVRR
jgi:NAD(P)-dependent dehydrogenase (short-subunit alcohol dehydrogenase family)